MTEKQKAKQKKMFVLDTSVILYDHSAVEHFGEHDVAIPITVLEELDNFKKGNDIKNFEAREFIRFVDQLSAEHKLQEWLPLNGTAKGRFRVLMNQEPLVNAARIFNDNKPDHQILNAALQLQEQNPKHRIILVTKDINLRLKARSLNLISEDYETGKIQNVTSLYTGMDELTSVDDAAINDLYEKGSIDSSRVLENAPGDNHYFILRGLNSSILAYYNPEQKKIERVD
ncbi:MAG TPA: PIN domain-containing protein, partial [Adhaeribacter sp.]|nr:PIN domain-containing protein [Adhaeribacter sp.]